MLNIHVAKTTFAVLLSTLTVLVPAINTVLQGTGIWAVITVVIVLLTTPGASISKAVNRTLGTAMAAGLAASVGTGCARLDAVAKPAGSIIVALTCLICVAVSTWLGSRPIFAQWSYALLLGSVTYCFLALDALLQQPELSAFRAGTIAGAGVVALVLAFTPPYVLASELARAHLADTIADSAACFHAVVVAFLAGTKLHPIETIYQQPAADDLPHKAKMKALKNKEALDGALKMAAWETVRTANDKVDGYAACGRSARMVVYCVSGLDTFLRQPFVPLRREIEAELRLAEALELAAEAVTAEFHAAIAHRLQLPLSVAQAASQVLSVDTALRTLEQVTEAFAGSESPMSMSNGTRDDSGTRLVHLAFARLTINALIEARGVRAALEGDRLHAKVVVNEADLQQHPTASVMTT